MATVPKSRYPDGTAQPVPSIRVPTQAPMAAFGGGEPAQNVYAGAGALAQEAGKVFQQHLEDALEAQTVDNLSQLSAKETELKLKLQNVKGRDALDAANRVGQEFEEFQQKLAQGTANPLVQRRTQQHAQKYKESLNAWGQQYATNEFRKWDGDRVEAAIQNERDAAIADGTTARIGLALERQKALYQDYGQRAGWSPEVLQAQTGRATSATHSGVLDMMLANGRDLDAKGYYEANRDGFIGDDAIRAARNVETGSYRGLAQREVQRILAGSLSDVVDGPPQAPTEQQTFAAVDKIQDPKLQDMVRGRLREYWQDTRRIEHDQAVSNSTEAANIVAANKSVDAIPPSLWNTLPLSTRKSLEDYAADLRKGAAPQAASDAYLRLRLMSATDPQGFIMLDLNSWRGKITDAEIKELVGDQAGILKSDPRTTEKNRGFLSLEETANMRLKELGLNDGDQVAEFKRQLNRDYVTWKKDPKNKDREPTPEEFDVMVDNLIGSERKWYKLWLGKAPVIQFKDYEAIPRAERNVIEDEIKKAGQEPTPSRVLDLYRRKQKP